jgi:hypothetical protein
VEFKSQFHSERENWGRGVGKGKEGRRRKKEGRRKKKKDRARRHGVGKEEGGRERDRGEKRKKFKYYEVPTRNTRWHLYYQ